MARKVKIDNAIQTRFARQESSRKQDIRAKRRFFLIVCEGAKTEPNYFRGLEKNLPPGVANTVELAIEGKGHNTLTVIQDALNSKKRLENQGRTIDEVWAVFDRDDFPADHFNRAILNSNKVGVQCAWTNEAFELWYLLHFQFYQHSILRADYKAKIERELTKKLGSSYRYEKNSTKMFELLQQHGDIEKAIERAEQLGYSFEGRTDYANHNPCTKVYELIGKLIFPDRKPEERWAEYLQHRREQIRK